MLDILMDVVKLSSFPPVTTAREGHKKGFEESGSSSWTKEPRAASPPGAAGSMAPALDYLGLVLSWGKAELAPQVQTHVQPLAARKKGLFISSQNLNPPLMIRLWQLKYKFQEQLLGLDTRCCRESKIAPKQISSPAGHYCQLWACKQLEIYKI